MKIIFSEQAWDDYLYWQSTDKKMVNRIDQLIEEIQRLKVKEFKAKLCDTYKKISPAGVECE